MSKLCTVSCFLLFLLLLSSAADAVQLREIKKIPLPEEARVYGLSSGNIIIASDSGLTVLGRRWEVRSEFKFDNSQTVIVSDNGLYYALLEVIEGDGGDSSAVVATLYNSRGMPLWGAYDLIEGQYFLSPSGEYIVAVSGTPGYYDFEMVLYHKGEAALRYNIEYFEDILFSPDGTRFMVGSGPKGVRLFDATGQMLKEFEPQKTFAFSETGKLIGLFKNGLLDVLLEDDRKVTVEPKKVTLAGMKLQESAHLAAMAFRTLVAVASLEDGSILWRYTTGKELGHFTSVDISPNGKFVACGVDVMLGRGTEMSDRHTKSYLYVYDAWGQSVEVQEIKFQVYAEGMPEVTFSPDNRIIFVRTADALHFIEMY